ncbi:hypothetical protein [Halostella sp. PRR32]|uniref:hypothetical protein n=1 Tax=Halostella sp. PRR32 TaxID=3098147 RepID=UPI002B1E0436|nr:hypothetical protein [Halostella sp. PRR32]
MSLGDWLGETYRRFGAEDPVTALRESTDELYRGGLRRLDAVWRFAPTVYDREWDLLVVLDGCRADLMASVASDYRFLDRPRRVASPASHSHDWLERTFGTADEAAVAETAYVTANPFSDELLDPNRFAALDEVWRYAWDAERETVPPRPVTDRTITLMRDCDPERVVAHYMQPHFPSIPDPGVGAGFQREDAGWLPGNAWEKLRDGEVSEERLWTAYRNNLEHVLDDVAVLLENADAERAVVTADHGNALGEWGVYGHPRRMPLPSLHLVPWYETTATDAGGYDPATYDQSAGESVGEKLRDLGYLAD